MAVRKLSPELISLIHNISLNESNWWKKTIQRIVTYLIWEATNSITNRAEILEALSKYYEIKISRVTLEEVIEELKKESIVELPTGQIKISDQTRLKINQSIEKQIEIENNTKLFFEDTLRKYGNLSESISWSKFEDNFLIPIINELGAKIYEYFNADQNNLGETVHFGRYLDSFKPDMKANAKAFLVEFLNPGVETVRSYVLRKMLAYFSVEAGGLSSEQVGRISENSKTKPTFNIFVDTNFMFSILGLHENPANDSANALVELMKELSHFVTIKLYVAPITIDEAIRVIDYHYQSLKDIRTTIAMANSINNITLSGFGQRYFNQVRSSQKAISVKDYFEPYLNNFLPVVRGKGIELYNANLDKYYTRQDVVDDIASTSEHEQKKFHERAKNYERIQHDIILWHLTKDLRPGYISSPVDAKYWIVTVDYRFLGFDSFKHRSVSKETSLCMHPLSLVQLLQFWAPRTKKMEDAMFNSVRFPFLFEDFNHDAEKTTLAILSTISRFEDLPDLPEEAIREILVDKAMRQKMKGNKTIEENIETVRTSLSDTYKNVFQEVDRLKEMNSAAEKTLKETKESADNLDSALKLEIEAVSRKESELAAMNARLQKLEKESEAKIAYSNELARYNANKTEFISHKVDQELVGGGRFIFTALFILLSIAGIFAIYKMDLQRKEILTMVIFSINMVLSFVNKDKIFKSFNEIFRFRKYYSNLTRKFDIEYSVSNPVPKFDDSSNQ